MIQEETMKRVFSARLNGLMRGSRVDFLDVAIDIGCSHSAVRSWAHGKTLPNGRLLIELCRAFGITIGFALGTNEYPSRYDMEPFNEKEIGQIFNRKLERILGEKRISVYDFAENYLYVSPTTIQTMMRAQRMPKTARMIEICEALHVDPNYMCGYTEKPKNIAGSDLWRAQYGSSKA